MDGHHLALLVGSGDLRGLRSFPVALAGEDDHHPGVITGRRDPLLDRGEHRDRFTFTECPVPKPGLADLLVQLAPVAVQWGHHQHGLFFPSQGPGRVAAGSRRFPQVVLDGRLHQLTVFRELRHPTLLLQHLQGIARVGSQKPAVALQVQGLRHLKEPRVPLAGDLLHHGEITVSFPGELRGVEEEGARLDALHLLRVPHHGELHLETVRLQLLQHAEQLLRLAPSDKGRLVQPDYHLRHFRGGLPDLQNVRRIMAVFVPVQEGVDGVGCFPAGACHRKGGLAGVGNVDGLLLPAGRLQDLGVEPLDHPGDEGLAGPRVALRHGEPPAAGNLVQEVFLLPRGKDDRGALGG